MGNFPRAMNKLVTRFMMNMVKYPQIYDNLERLLAREMAAPAPVEPAAAAPARATA